MVHRALGHSNPSCTLHSPCSNQPRAGVFLVGDSHRLRIPSHIPCRHVGIAILSPKRNQFVVALEFKESTWLACQPSNGIAGKSGTSFICSSASRHYWLPLSALVLDSVGGNTSKPISLISEENDRRQSRSILISGRALGPKRLSNVNP